MSLNTSQITNQIISNCVDTIEIEDAKILSKISKKKYIELLVASIANYNRPFPEIIYCIEIIRSRKSVVRLNFQPSSILLHYAYTYISKDILIFMVEDFPKMIYKHFRFLEVLEDIFLNILDRYTQIKERVIKAFPQILKIFTKNRFSRNLFHRIFPVIQCVIKLKLMIQYEYDVLPRGIYLLDQNKSYRGIRVMNKLIWYCNHEDIPFPEIIQCIKFHLQNGRIMFYFKPRKALIQACMKNLVLMHLLNFFDSQDIKNYSYQRAVCSQDKNYDLILKQLHIIYWNKDDVYQRLEDTFETRRVKKFIKKLEKAVKVELFRFITKGEAILKELESIQRYLFAIKRQPSPYVSVSFTSEDSERPWDYQSIPDIPSDNWGQEENSDEEKEKEKQEQKQKDLKTIIYL